MKKKIIIYDKNQSKLKVKRDLSLTPDSSKPPHFRERSSYIFFNFFSMLFYHKKFGGALLSGLDTIQAFVMSTRPDFKRKIYCNAMLQLAVTLAMQHNSWLSSCRHASRKFFLVSFLIHIKLVHYLFNNKSTNVSLIYLQSVKK